MIHAHTAESREHVFGANCSATLIVIVIAVLTISVLPVASQTQPPLVESQSSPAPSSPTATATIPDDYLIGEDDVLNVYVVDVPEFSRQYRVSSGGTVTVPMLPQPIPAAGLTLMQFSDRMGQELKASGLVSSPHVSASVDQSRLHAVAITGAVKRPQVYPLFTRTTLLDMISQAEGLADDAGEVAIIQRGAIANHAMESDSKQNSNSAQPLSQTVSVDLKQLLDGRSANANVAIYPGDRITVPRAGVVYVVGAVNKPGGFTMKANSHGMTVLQAIALAENTTNTAIRNQSVIIRNDATAPDGHKQIPVDLKKLLQGKGPDPTLQAEDVLFIPDSSGKRALHRTVDSILQVTTGVAIYSARF
jgi:polysaccharide export outer membrane protein